MITRAAPAKPPCPGAQWHPSLNIWTTGGRVIKFIETVCLLTNGRWTGDRFILLPWQRTLLYELFEVDATTGRRIYRRALIGLPRKSGKTELLAAILLYLMLADGEKSAAVYCAAASEEQADMVFDAMKRMCELEGAPLAELVDVAVSRLTKKTDPYSFAQRLTSKGRTKHGLNPFAVGLDELHAWGAGEGDELWAALNTGSAARLEPMQIAITTAGQDLEESRCGQMYLLGREIERGAVPHGGFFFRWWQAPEGMDYRDPEYPRLASPSYGHTTAEGFYEGELSAVPEAVFRRLYGNEWIDYGDAPWVTREQIRACRVKDFKLRKNASTWVGVDLSETRDSTAVAWGQWNADVRRPCGHTGEPCLYLEAKTWEQPRLPSGRPDQEWEVPQGEVKAFIRKLNSRFTVATNVFDPWHSKLMRQDLEGEGIPCEEIHQTGIRRSGASSGLFDLIMTRRLHYQDDTFERHILNASVRETGRDGGYYLAKRRKGKVMDAAMAAVNVVYGTQHTEAPPGPSVYERRGVLAI